MNHPGHYRFPTNLASAYAEQKILKKALSFNKHEKPVNRVAGIAYCYRLKEKLLEVVVSIYSWKGELLKVVRRRGQPQLPQASLLMSYRVGPLLMEILLDLSLDIDAIMVRGYGLNHPEQFGLACHLGYLLQIPVWAVNDKPHSMIPNRNKALAPPHKACRKIYRDGALTSLAIQTQARLKPIIVSPGNKLSFEQAHKWSTHFVDQHKWPEPLRICINKLNEYYT